MTDDPGQRQPTEEELRAQLEQQLDSVHIDDVIVQVAVDLLNLAARRAGLGPQREGGEPSPAPDLAQAGSGIDAVKALLAIVEPRHGEKVKPLRDALSQLQMHYAQAVKAGEQGAAPAGADEQPASEQPTPKPGEAGPAQSSGRLWVPGQ